MLTTFEDLKFELRCSLNSLLKLSKINTYNDDDDQRLEKAIVYLKNNPDFLPARIRACELLLKSKDFYRAYDLSRRGRIHKNCKKLKKINQFSIIKLRENSGFAKIAEKFLLDGQLNVARKAIQKGLKSNPNDLETLLVALRIYKILNKQKKCLVIANCIRNNYPNNPESYSFLCEYAQKTKDLKMAYEVAKKAATNFSYDERFHGYLDKIRQKFIDQKDIKSALMVSKTLFDAYPKTGNNYYSYCEVLTNFGIYEDALSVATLFVTHFPHDNRALKVACRLTYKAKELERCLEYAEKLIKLCPKEIDGHEYKFKVLNSQSKLNEALSTLVNGTRVIKKKSYFSRIYNKISLSSLDISSIPKKEAIEIIEKLILLDPTNNEAHLIKLKLLTLHGMASVAQYHANYLLSQKNIGKEYIFKNNDCDKHLYLRALNLSKSDYDYYFYFWTQSFHAFPNLETEPPAFTHQPFQYWSQGRPTDDIRALTNQWNEELASVGLKKIILFDKNSALEWISINTPELVEPFNSSFHYAVEADVFRIAYALKNDCIWIDSDMVPTDVTASTLVQRLRSAKTTLTMQAKTPTLTNCFFATQKSSPFFVDIANEMRNYSFAGKIPSKELVVESFGPKRYSRTFKKLLLRYNGYEEGNQFEYPPQISSDWSINFVNKETFANAKPKAGLRYFRTNDNWVNFLKNNG